MFVIDRGSELVGYSAWGWDPVYSPVVGCYADGRCVGFAPCNQPAQRVGLEGPGERRWFRMTIDADTRAAIAEGDPAVRVVRMEDGEEIPFAGPIADAPPARVHRLEQFLSRTARRDVRADGFMAFLTAPHAHQIDAMFLDIFGRLPEPEGRAAYTAELEQGVAVLAIRDRLMASAEFANRRVTISDRVGALLTSPLWHQLAACDTPGDRRSMVKVVRIATYAAMDDLAFAARVHLDVHGDAPTPAAQTHLASLAELEGRMHVATLLVRDAAVGGNYVALVER